MMFLPSLPQVIILAAVSVAISATTGYGVGRRHGGEAVQAKWDADRVTQLQALTAAQSAKSQAEDAIAKQLAAQTQAHTQALTRRDAAVAGARSELTRLRNALAAPSPAGHPDPQAPATGPATDGSGTFRGILRSCAEELVQVGEHADRLAAQVTGLQLYANLAQRTCGQQAGQ